MKVEEKFIEILKQKKEELSHNLFTISDKKRNQYEYGDERCWMIDYIYCGFENKLNRVMDKVIANEIKKLKKDDYTSCILSLDYSLCEVLFDAETAFYILNDEQVNDLLYRFFVNYVDDEILQTYNFCDEYVNLFETVEGDSCKKLEDAYNKIKNKFLEEIDNATGENYKEVFEKMSEEFRNLINQN